ncbi:MAG: hypothetical protein WDN47_05410 [Candidatus Doudnabacteria bacterium]
MAKKSKPKTKTTRVKKYPTHHLVTILTCVLVLEGILFAVSTPADWLNAANILDVSGGVSETMQETIVTFQPMIDVVRGINQFYQLSATQMMRLLDLSDSGAGQEIGYIYNGVADFYQQTSSQMAQLLDVSDNRLWTPKVSGISIQR